MNFKRIYYDIIRHYWDLGFVVFPNNDIQGDWSYSFIKHNYKDRYFADPFILDVKEDTIELLVEECQYSKVKKGRIAKLTIDRSNLELKEMVIVLELETHLSFPAIIRKDGDVYVCPENAASGEFNLYRYNTEKVKLEQVKTLVHEPLSDAVLFEGFDKPCVIATKSPKSTSNIIEFYESDSVFGNYQHKESITINQKAGRGAGNLFVYNNRIYRPGQIASDKLGYGIGISFQTICKTEKGDYLVEELFEKYPPKGYVGMHTFNEYNGLYVVDCRKHFRPIISKTLSLIVSTIKKLF